MSIDYINRKEFEEVLYPAWAKGREPDPEDWRFCLMSRIEQNRKILACDVLDGIPVGKTMTRLKLEAKDASLWHQFQNEFKIGPMQPGDIIAVSGALLAWKKKL